MFAGYHLQNRGHALQQLNKMVLLPEARLGVGAGETLNPMTMKVQIVQGKQTVVVPDVSTRSFEQAHIDGQGSAVNPEDFPKLNYIGEMTQGGY
jgi:hypothetical protein